MLRSNHDCALQGASQSYTSSLYLLIWLQDMQARSCMPRTLLVAWHAHPCTHATILKIQESSKLSTHQRPVEQEQHGGCYGGADWRCEPGDDDSHHACKQTSKVCHKNATPCLEIMRCNAELWEKEKMLARKREGSQHLGWVTRNAAKRVKRSGGKSQE